MKKDRNLKIGFQLQVAAGMCWTSVGPSPMIVVSYFWTLEIGIIIVNKDLFPCFSFKAVMFFFHEFLFLHPILVG